MKSQPLALLGLKEVWKQLQEKLNSLGIFSARESVGRIDFAIDFLMPSGFELQPNRFVAHAKATNAEHDYTIKPQKIAPDEFQVHWRGRVASSVTIGKMPGRQLIVYDKHQEVMQKRKFHWFEIWKLAEEEKTFPIFRVEVRAGKAHLKNWNVTTFEQLQTNIADILVSAVSSIRYVIENPEEENVSRWRPDRLWREVSSQLSNEFPEGKIMDVPGKMISGRRDMIFDMYLSQIVALFPGVLVAGNFNSNDHMAKFEYVMRKLKFHFGKTDPSRFGKKLQKAKEKLHFI